MPKCTYGSACNRKDCVYSHPPKNHSKGGGGEEEVGGCNVCIHFIMGTCEYSRCDT